MSGPDSLTQWYLARDGQQFGPLSDAELAKFVELGHMQPNDLLWRDGFPDWRPAMVVFPPRPQPAGMARPMPTLRTGAPAQAARQPSEVVQADIPRERFEPPSDDVEREPRRRLWTRLGVVLLLIVALGTVVWFALPYRERLWGAVGSVSAITTSDVYAVADRKSLEVPPLAGFSDNPEATDAKLQETALWRVLKRDFPDWYSQRLSEAAELARSGRDEAGIGELMARRLVELRRQQVTNALSATLPRLKSVASKFYDNLAHLQRDNTEACYGFISQGEANPAIVKLLRGSPHTPHLQAQLTSVFEAIAEGRKQPRVYPQPRQTDYDMLATDLKKRGWTPADMQLFSNERALAKASPEKVCQMVHDWFAAQLALPDTEAQMRLLVESLRPVVAG